MSRNVYPKIDGLLNNAIEERYCIPKEYEIAYEYLKDLCCEIVEKGYDHLIQEFVDIASKDNQIINREETRRRHQLGLLKDKDGVIHPCSKTLRRTNKVRTCSI